LDILMPSFSYILLTDELPRYTHELGKGYNLKTVKATPEMLRGFFLDIGEEYNALMTLPYIDDNSFETYKDLVVFHSFISDNPKTYEFAENVTETSFEISKLNFIEDISKIDIGKIATLDFDLFPVTTESNTEKPKVEYINYKKAFDLFSELKLNDKTRELYNQICLYVFARSLESITKIYCNSYIAVSFYITILESIIGKPPTCNETLTCPKCGMQIPNHTTVSLEKHFINHYGSQFKKLRNIRHKTFHKGEYSDLTGSWVKLYTKLYKSGARTNNELENTGRLQAEIMDLEYIVQEKLKILFLKQYSEY